MPLIPALLTFSPGTVIRSASENTNNATLRDTLNASALFIDVSRVITAPQTFEGNVTFNTGVVAFDGGVTFNVAPTFAAGFTVTGGVAAFGSITATSLTVATDFFSPNVRRPNNTGTLSLAGGLSDASGNGASIFMTGNSSPYNGAMWINAGNNAGGRIVFRTGADVERGAIESNGNFTYQFPFIMKNNIPLYWINAAGSANIPVLFVDGGNQINLAYSGNQTRIGGNVQMFHPTGYGTVLQVCSMGADEQFIVKCDNDGYVRAGSLTAHGMWLITNNVNRLLIDSAGNSTFTGPLATSGGLTVAGNTYLQNAVYLQNVTVNDFVPASPNIRFLNTAASVANFIFSNLGDLNIARDYYGRNLNASGNIAASGNMAVLGTGTNSFQGLVSIKSPNDSLPVLAVLSNAGAQVFTVAGTGSVVASTGMTSPLLHARTAVGTAGYIAIVAGDASNVGYIEFHKPGPTRICYMGYGSGAALVMNLEGGVSFNVTGGQLVVGNSGINTSGSIVASGNIDANGTFSTLSNIALQNNDRYLYGTRPSSGQWRLIGIAASDQLRIGEETGNVCLKGVAHGFFNTAPIAKPTVTGSRSGIVALTSLMIALAALGLVTDSTT